MIKKYHIEIDPFDGPHIVTTYIREISDYPQHWQDEIKRLEKQIEKLEGNVRRHD